MNLLFRLHRRFVVFQYQLERKVASVTRDLSHMTHMARSPYIITMPIQNHRNQYVALITRTGTFPYQIDTKIRRIHIFGAR